MAANVVEITVRATDDTAAGFAGAKAGAAGTAAAMDDLAGAQIREADAEREWGMASAEAADAQAKLGELQRSAAADAEELAAAEDKAAMSARASRDAWLELQAAQADVARTSAVAADAAGATAAKTDEAAVAAEAGGAGLMKFGQLGALAEVAVGYEAIKMSMNFQSAMERLVTQAGVPQKMLAPLKAGILDLAGAVGFSPESLSESLYHVASNMASLGATAPKMLDMVRVAAEGAKVGGANLEDVTNALTAAVASGIPGVQNYTQAMGALNAIVGAGDMKMQDLADAMGSGLMAVVKGYGLSLKDVGAALDVFGDNNIRGAHAATDLRMAVQALAVPAAAGKAELASMGLTMSSLGTTMRDHGMLAALEELQAHFKAAGITAKEQGGVITEIFGKKAGVGLAVLMDQMDRLKSKYPDIEAGAKNFGSAWQKTGQTLSQQWDEIKASFDSMLTGLGDKLLPVLSSIAGFLTRNEGVIKALAPVVMTLVGAFTLLAGAMKVISLVSELNPWMVAIAAVIAITVLLITHWKEVSKIAKEVWHDAAQAVASAWDTVYADTIGPVVRAFDYIKSFITGSFDGWWKSHGGEVKEVWHVLWTAIHDIFEYEWVPIIAVLKAGWDMITIIFKTGMAVVTDVFKAGWAYTVAVFKVAWDLISASVRVAVDYISMIIKVTWDIIVGVFNVFLDLVTGHWSKAWTDIQRMFEQVWNAIKEFFGQALSDITGAFSRAMSAVVSAARSIVSDMFNAGKAVVEGFINGIKSMLGDVGHIASSIGHAVLGGVKDVLGIFSPSREAFTHGQMYGQGLINGLLSMQEPVRSAAGRLAGSVSQGAGSGSLAGAGAGGGDIIIRLGTGGSGLDQMFMTWLKNATRTGGGDPSMYTKKVKFL